METSKSTGNSWVYSRAPAAPAFTIDTPLGGLGPAWTAHPTRIHSQTQRQVLGGRPAPR